MSGNGPTQSTQPDNAGSPLWGADRAGWTAAILLAARHLEIMHSPQQVNDAASWAAYSLSEEQQIQQIAVAAGLQVQSIAMPAGGLTPALLPALIVMDNHCVAVATEADQQGVDLLLPLGEQIIRRHLTPAQLAASSGQHILLLQARKPVTDRRLDEYLIPPKGSWFTSLFFKNKMTLFELSAGSLFSNILAIATSLFAMQVWDRVVPARSLNTLWVLASGVMLALILEFLIRTLRVELTDRFGKRADLALSAQFFSHTLDIKNDARPKSHGTLISQLRDLEMVRELLTSSTLGAIIDLPFVLAFLLIIYLLGGSLVWVPLAAIPLLVIPGICLQLPLARLSKAGMSEAAIRHAILLESIHQIEDIKVLQAAPRFKNIWQRVTAKNASVSMAQRKYISVLLHLTQLVQQLAYVGVVIVGVYNILDGTLSFGAVLACSILTSRTIAPLSQISVVLGRLQNARVSKRGLDRLLALPCDHGQQHGYHKPVLMGHYQFDNVAYAYGPMEKAVLSVPRLTIQPGEKVAILGQVGAGKSTLLRLLGGLAEPQQGSILLDGTQMNLIDIGDVRRDIGFLLQDSGLFYGTLRDNLKIASPLASDEALLQAMSLSCADRLILNQPHGMDLIINEGGKGLSGGQRQSLMLARLLLRAPNIVLLDEPTASLDEMSETQIINHLAGWLKRRTLVVATHRYSLLRLVDRIIVIHNGRIVRDGPKQQILDSLSGKTAAASAVTPVSAGGAII